jgi:hypothetical protein
MAVAVEVLAGSSSNSPSPSLSTGRTELRLVCAVSLYMSAPSGLLFGRR